MDHRIAGEEVKLKNCCYSALRGNGGKIVPGSYFFELRKESVSLDAEVPRGAERIGWIFKEFGMQVSSF